MVLMVLEFFKDPLIDAISGVLVRQLQRCGQKVKSLKYKKGTYLHFIFTF